MKVQYDNNILGSIFFWSENELLSKGEAYKNYTSKLYYTQDLRLNGYNSYSSPFKQWVYNTNISGAYICSGISGSINLSNNQSGMKIDYENGRVLIPSSFGTGLNISGSYSFKELNFYLTNENEEFLLTESKYFLNSRFLKQRPTSGISPYTQVTPAIFINSVGKENSAFALGGTKYSKNSISMVVMAENVFQLDATLSIFADTKEKYLTLLNVTDDPIDEYGNIKTGVYPNGYNYKTLIQSKGNQDNLLFIEDVFVSKISDKVKANKDLFFGIVDITVGKPRIIPN